MMTSRLDFIGGAEAAAGRQHAIVSRMHQPAMFSTIALRRRLIMAIVLASAFYFIAVKAVLGVRGSLNNTNASTCASRTYYGPWAAGAAALQAFGP
jgi:hypothetical protein